MAVLFTVFEFVGTVSFAISGAMEAIRHKMDLFGIIMLGLVTACGGGVLRDIVIGVTPPRVFQNPMWAVLAMTISLLVFIILRFSKAALQHFARLREALYFLADTGGLAAFTVLGIESAGEGNAALLLFVGMITGVGGGVLRDVLAGTIPGIFRKHIYALACAAGALTDILLMHILPKEIAMLSGFCMVVLVRALANHFQWNLPHVE